MKSTDHPGVGGRAAVDHPTPSAAATPSVGPRAISPCINVCRMDERTGWCEGCLRTLDEIATWSILDADEREAVWRSLDDRRHRATP
jgi:uncharacterized protein